MINYSVSDNSEGILFSFCLFFLPRLDENLNFEHQSRILKWTLAISHFKLMPQETSAMQDSLRKLMEGHSDSFV